MTLGGFKPRSTVCYTLPMPKPPESGPSYNPIAAGNPFRKRGIDPRTGKPIKPQEPGQFVGKYLGPKAAKAVQELLASDKAKKKTTEVDLNSLMTEEEKAALEAKELKEEQLDTAREIFKEDLIGPDKVTEIWGT